MRAYKKETELREIAETISDFITIRSRDNGCSVDTTRWAKKQEKDIIFKIAYGSLLALNWGEKCRDSKDMAEAIVNNAEFTINNFLPECNGYMTMYIPLNKILQKWEQI